MLPAKFGSIWPSSFRGEDFFNISQSETRIALGGHICWQKILKVIPQCCARSVGRDVFFVDARNGSHFVQNGHHFFIKFIKQGTCSKII